MGEPLANARLKEDMIERVAMAIQATFYDGQRIKVSDEYGRAMARAAVEAMREPTDAMMAAADDRAAQAKELSWPLGSWPLGMRELLKQYIWGDMIDAALLQANEVSGSP